MTSKAEKTLLALATPNLKNKVGKFVIREKTQVLAQFVVNNHFVGFGIGDTARQAKEKAAQAVLGELCANSEEVKSIIEDIGDDDSHAYLRLGLSLKHEVMMMPSGVRSYGNSEDSSALGLIAEQYQSSDEDAGVVDPSPEAYPPRLNRGHRMARMLSARKFR